jgi:hypothetical protein
LHQFLFETLLREQEAVFALKKQVRTWNEEGRSNFFYPLYSGWQFPTYPYFFKQPAHAACWAISRFKRDGLGNSWGADKYPSFLQFVGTVSVKNSNIHPVISPTYRSEIEYRFFLGVEFYLPKKEYIIFSDTNYVQLSTNTFYQCTQGFKCAQDYQLSSNSIYKSRVMYYCSCITSNIVPEHSGHYAIEQKLASSKDGLVMFEKLFKYMKSPFHNYGEWNLY